MPRPNRGLSLPLHGPKGSPELSAAFAANIQDQLFDRLGRNKWWTKESVIGAIRVWHRRTGYPPTSTEWMKPSGAGYRHLQTGRRASRPHAQTVYAIFGSWSAAIEAAGFQPLTSGEARQRQPRCRRGHLWTEENTIIRSDGGRRCRACKKAADRARYLARRPKKRCSCGAEFHGEGFRCRSCASASWQVLKCTCGECKTCYQRNWKRARR